jgi:hypothetical protein
MAYTGGLEDVDRRAHDPAETYHLDLVAGKGRAGRPDPVDRNPDRVRGEEGRHVRVVPSQAPHLVHGFRTAGRHHRLAGHRDLDRGAGSLASRRARPLRAHRRGATSVPRQPVAADAVHPLFPDRHRAVPDLVRGSHDPLHEARRVHHVGHRRHLVGHAAARCRA